jgi:uncharacterized membrane protein YebE (DUF533 family)
MFSDLLGQMIQAGGMTRSGTDRVGHALGPQGLGGEGGPLAALLGGAGAGEGAGGNPLAALRGGGGGAGAGDDPLAGLLRGTQGTGSGGAAGGLGGMLSGLAESAKGMFGEAGRSVQSGNPLAIGGLGALAGALLGGGGGAAKGAVGGGALALLGTIAVSALKNWGQDGATPSAEEVVRDAPLGLREPQTPAEHEELETTAQLVLRAMISAAKADGEIDAVEVERIAGKLREGGVDAEERAFVMAEMRRPIDLDGLIGAVRSPEVAVEVYAASLLAIEVDTAAERDYLSRLAGGLRLHPETVRRIHQALGVAV